MEQSLQITQLLIGHTQRPEHIAQLQVIVDPLLRLWVTTCLPEPRPSALQFSLHSLLSLICAWRMHQRQLFDQQLQALVPAAALVAKGLVAGCRMIRPLLVRVALLVTSLSLAEAGADDAFWRDFMACSQDLIRTTEKAGCTATLSEALNTFRSSLQTRLPSPARSSMALCSVVLPVELHQFLRDDGTVDEVPLVRSFFGITAQGLRRISATQGLNVQALLGAAPPQVQEAFHVIGL